MDSLATIGFIIACAALGQSYRLSKRVKALEKPIEQKKREKMLITKAEVLALIEENKKG